ncbi:MAG: diaminopimelate decarboxylase, partial [Chloroflexota bacterium]
MSRVLLEHREVPAVAPAAARLIESSRGLETPFLLVDRTRLRDNARRLQAAFPGAGIYYAVKANPDPEILRVLANEGCGFEISSSGELALV